MKHFVVLSLFSVLALAGCKDDKSNIRPPEQLVELASPVPVQRIWEVRVGDGADESGIRMQAAVADGVVYVASINGKLRAINAATGETVWQLERDWRGDRDVQYSGGPVVVDGVLYVGTLDGHVHAINAVDGSLIWSVALGAEVLSQPEPYEESLLVRTGDGDVRRLSQADGSVEWIYDRGQVPLLSLRGNSRPLAARGAVFLTTDDGKLVGLRAEDGSTIWEREISGGDGRTDIERLADADGNLVLTNDVLYVGGYHGKMLAVSAAGGRVLWDNDFSGYTGFAVDDGKVVAVDDGGSVWAFDAESGGNLWQQDGLAWRWLSPPAIQGDRVVVADFRGYVHWLDLETGELVARARLEEDPIRSRPVVDGDIVYVTDIAGHTAAFRIGAG